MTESLIWVETPACPHCGRTAQVEITPKELASIEAGAFKQVALKDRTPAFRELFISGTHEHCWLALFGSEDEWFTMSPSPPHFLKPLPFPEALARIEPSEGGPLATFSVGDESGLAPNKKKVE